MYKVSIVVNFHCVILVNGVRIECVPGDVVSYESKDFTSPSVCLVELKEALSVDNG